MEELLSDKLSIRGKNLKTKLTVIASLLFVQPFFIVFYILYTEGIYSEVSYLYLMLFMLLLIFSGLFILREIFDKFTMVASHMRRMESGEIAIMDDMRDTAELREISSSFNAIAARLADTTGKFETQTAELERILGERNHFERSFNRSEEELRKLNEELERKVEERTNRLVSVQEELIRNMELSALGQLAGNVSHELRNPLGVMNNAVYFLQSILPDADEKVREYLEIIRNEIDNSQQIISDLLDYYHSRAPQKAMTTVRQLVERCLKGCVIPENVRLRIEIAGDTPTVLIDPKQMEQVLRNLVTNAVQAMPAGGELGIAARRCDKIGTPPRETADYLKISITDTGEGIAPENMERLFQPLFTTRSRGIGLGLTLSKKLAEANGGRIEVQSRLGEGTTFVMILPIMEN